MNNLDKELDEIFKQNELEKINDKLYLTRNQIDILERYDIEYKSKSIDELIFEIEDILNYEDSDELDKLSMDLS